MKTLMTVCGAVALLASGAAFAASDTATTTTTTTTSSAKLDPSLANMSAEQLKDKDVIGSDGQQIADVEGVVSKGGQTYFVLDADGVGGMDAKDVVLPANRFKMQGDKLSVDMTKNQMQGLEKWQKGQYEDVKGALK